jgi:hypothetical protein
MSRIAEFRERVVTPDAVYGTILFAAVVAALSDEDDLRGDIVSTLIFSVITQIVFWIAHVFAGAVAGHGAHGGEVVPLGTATSRAIRHSLGLLYGPVLPAVPLLLGSFGLIAADDAGDLSLLIAMIILGVLGYLAFADRGARVIVRVLGALGSAFLGFVIIVLNMAVH